VIINAEKKRPNIGEIKSDLKELEQKAAFFHAQLCNEL